MWNDFIALRVSEGTAADQPRETQPVNTHNTWPATLYEDEASAPTNGLGKKLSIIISNYHNNSNKWQDSPE